MGFGFYLTTPAPHRSMFTGRVLFLTTNQQRQNIEGKTTTTAATITSGQSNLT